MIDWVSHLPHVSHHDLLEVQIKVAGENAVLGGAHQQLAALALAHGPDGAQVVGQLRLQPRLPVERVELDDPAVPAAPRDDGPVLEHADGEDGAVVDLPDDLGHGVVSSAPDEHVAVAVSGDDVTIACVRQAGHILKWNGRLLEFIKHLL